jgi:hypothetical protein
LLIEHGKLYGSAEFGFLGVVVYTLVQTPLLCGQASNAGTPDLIILVFLGLRTSWLIVAIKLAPNKRSFPETILLNSV